jgi:2,4-dienoyl-CoA reductase-like NADH-dependent reductase (Old Yellow Enzyme family)/thioredoxin reductase
MSPLSKLFSPVSIGKMELKNRLVMAPMVNGFANDDGSVSQRMIDFYEARARGGVSLIILPSVSVDKASKFGCNPVLWDDRFVPGLKDLVKKLHAYGTRVVPELVHPGSGASYVSSMSLEDIKQAVRQFDDAARRAREAGCDGVEIHAAHAFLLVGSFLSGLRNRRVDDYGGPIENRLKLPLEIVKSIHDSQGRDFPVIMRISTDEMVPGGRDIRGTQYIAPILAWGGVDALDLSIGITGDWRHAPPTGGPQAINVAYSRAIKEAVDIPVMVVSRIIDARLAEDILNKGEADIVMMGRALLADPDLPNKSAEGRFEDIAPCIGCRSCMARTIYRPGISTGKITCLVNHAVGLEKEMAIHAVAKPKNVMVVGGGPGGLEAARVAALRGHRVTLYEKGSLPGGQFNLAIVPPTKQELVRVIQYLSTQANKAGVQVMLKTEVTPELIAEAKPDAVIIATGGEPFIPDIPGIKGKRIFTANEVFAEKVTVPPGNILIIGGGSVGCEAADFLANVGDVRPGTRLAVTIIEMLEDVACDAESAAREWLMQRLRAKGVRILTSTKVKAILEDGVVITRNGSEESIRGIDTIILATGAKAVNQLEGAIRDKVAEIYVIGDARDPRTALEAIAEGAEAGIRV